MTDQHLWFEPVSLLSRCSLNEGLLWVWADRVPVDTVYREKNVFESLQDWEFERLNIPPAPRGLGRAAQYRTEERLRKRTYRRLLKNAREYHVLTGMEEAETARQWLPLITSAMEVPATELFLKLRYGQIEALGKLLPVGVEIIDFLEDQNSYSRGNFDNLVDSVVPHHFWTQRGIDWFSNAVTADGNCYCDVSMPVEVLMSLFPGERTPVEGAEFVGDFLLVKAPNMQHRAGSEKSARTPSRVCVGGVSRRVRGPNQKRADASEERGSNSANGELVCEHAGRTNSQPVSRFRKAHALLSEVLL